MRRFLVVTAALALALAVPGVARAGLPGGPNPPQPVVTFPAGSFPESITLADRGAYITLGFAGSLVRFSGSAVQTVATVPVGSSSLLTGVAVSGGNAYFAQAPFGGVGPSYLYRVPTAGTDLTPAPWIVFAANGSFPNGLVVRANVLYVADMSVGAIRAVSLDDSSISTWCESPLLAPGHFGFGVNGITFGRDGAMYASVSDFGRIVRITRAGGACSVTTVVEDQQLRSADGIAFGPDGLLYVAVNTNNRLSTVNVTTGAVHAVAGRSDGLSYPTQPVFPDAHTVWVTNGAIANGVADVVGFPIE